MVGSHRIVFLDRDGTINVDTGYLSSPDELVLLPGAGEAIAKLLGLGYYVIVVTNQSGVARGVFSEETAHHINTRLMGLLEPYGAVPTAVYVCPHHPTAGADPSYTRECDCRKPRPGMALKAVKDLGLSPDWGSCWVVGDKLSDVSMAGALGCNAILVRTGHGEGEALAPDAPVGVEICVSLVEAVAYICRPPSTATTSG